MKKFMNEDFLLKTTTAKALYEGFAKGKPIIDYHCHINPAEIADNRRFSTITEAWLGGDHYKWRLMRGGGVPEELITGNGDDRDKFLAFAATLPRAIGNPIYHWCHLELKRYFGYDGILNEKTAGDVYDLCNSKLAYDDNLSVRGIIKQSGVVAIGTTDDPIDTLEHHRRLAGDEAFDVTVIPSYRPDKAVNVDKPGFADYIAKLSTATGITAMDVDSLYAALSATIDKFAAHGARASDHALDYVCYREGNDGQVNAIFKKAMAGDYITLEETEIYKTALMKFFGERLWEKGMVMQLHYGAMRDNNKAAYRALGPDTGFDAIADTGCAAGLAGFLNALCEDGKLPKTIIYSLNPNDNAAIGTLLGCFQGEGIRGKIQHGSAWWFNDTKSGMVEQMTSLANLGILGNFIGMLTDSRSFLSYTRHEYFRRILCDMLGDLVENGEYPADIAPLGSLVEDICINNAKAYFSL